MLLCLGGVCLPLNMLVPFTVGEQNLYSCLILMPCSHSLVRRCLSLHLRYNSSPSNSALKVIFMQGSFTDMGT